jgi:hypothetical protein
LGALRPALVSQAAVMRALLKWAPDERQIVGVCS